MYNALEWTAAGKVAVKVHTGEPGNNFLKPAFIASLVRNVNGTIVENNTAYGGRRASTAIYNRLLLTTEAGNGRNGNFAYSVKEGTTGVPQWNIPITGCAGSGMRFMIDKTIFD
ncbi:hypothetical protein PilKf_01667 [Pillotina sp. SPG140]